MYEGWSGQLINKKKSAIFFSKSSSFEQKNFIIRETGFKECQFPMLNLGVPIVQGMLSARHLESLTGKIQKKIAGWKMVLLSQGGRLVLLRHVFSSMAIYLLSVLRISKSGVGI